MRRIDPNRFHVATRGTSRQINRQIALTLIGSHQPISRADLARRMKMRRGAVGLLVQELLADRHIVEGTHRRRSRAAGNRRCSTSTRGRDRASPWTSAPAGTLPDARRSDGPAAVGYRQPADGAGSQAVCCRSGGDAFVDCSSRIAETAGKCEGIGVVVPGMVDPGTGCRDACADAAAGATSTCADGSLRRPDWRCTSRTPDAPARWRSVWEARKCRGAGAEPGVRQRLRRRRRRHRGQRRTAARQAQHRRRVCAHADQRRSGSALLLRRDRMLGSAHLKSRDADALLRQRPQDEPPRTISRSRSAT